MVFDSNEEVYFEISDLIQFFPTVPYFDEYVGDDLFCCLAGGDVLYGKIQ